MKIKEITEGFIRFDNGNSITFDHYRDCCEENFADFKNIDNGALDEDFKEDLIFEAVDGCGFRFGSVGTRMYFVPCYSEQNGYYSDEIDIYYNGEKVLNFEAEQKYV